MLCDDDDDVTTSWLAATTQTRARIILVSPGFYPGALPAANLPISGLGTGMDHVACMSPGLGYNSLGIKAKLQQ